MQSELEDVDGVPRAGEPLRCGQRHETPILVVIVKPGIENSRNTKPSCPRHQSKGRQSSLWTCERHVIAWRYLPFLRKLFADEQRFNAIRVRGKVQPSGGDVFERLVAFSLP